IGYGAYVWLLKHCAPTKVATYAYVNPVIAVLLGWLVLHEPLTPIIGVAAAIVLAGVVLVQWPSKTPSH
ncbi:MAG: EamA family transporter, partial [Opitutales bacterium]